MRTFGRSDMNEDDMTVNTVTSFERIAGDRTLETNAGGVKIK